MFNRPSDPAIRGNSIDASDSASTGFLLEVFVGASHGSRVWGAFFHWDDTDFTEHLLKIVKERELNL